MSYLTTAVALGFGQTTYSFNEDVSGQVCVVIEQGGIESTQGVTLSVTLSDGTATGEFLILLVSSRCGYWDKIQ